MSRYTSSEQNENDLLSNTDFSKIMEVIDSLENTNYTFLVSDNDQNPFTFSNLIIRKEQDGTIESPYLIHYQLDSAFFQKFVESGFSLKDFSGQVTREYLTANIFSTRSSANLQTQTRGELEWRVR